MNRRNPLLAPLALVLALAFSAVVNAQENCVDDCGLSAEEIAAYPTPNVLPLKVDDALVYDRTYKKVVAEALIYDAPHGNPIETLASGFNYVTILSTQDNWSEISPGRWVDNSVLSDDVTLSRFAGVLLPDEPLPYPMAWVLRNKRTSARPGLEATVDAPLLLRYTRVNIYATVEVDGFRWYQVGDGQWLHQYDVAKIIPIERPQDVDTHKWISVDLYEQVAIAYEGEKAVFATLVSSGLPQWSTNEGLFNVYVRFQRTVMSGAYGQPDFYYLEEVPWTMYFDNDIALHGTYWHDGFGYRHSHGCVNLSITDAHWLFNWSSDEFDFTVPNDEGPAVYVYSSGAYR